VVSFLRRQRTNDGQAVADLGEFGQVVGDPQARRRGVDGSGFAAVVVIGLGVEGFQLAGAAGHP